MTCSILMIHLAIYIISLKELAVVHLDLIWVISEASPLTCNDSWFDAFEEQLTAAESSSRQFTSSSGLSVETIRQSEDVFRSTLLCLFRCVAFIKSH